MTEYVIWPMPGDPPRTWAHVVTHHDDKHIELVCGLQVALKGATFGTHRLVKKWRACPACAKGRSWDDETFRATFGGKA